MNTDKPRAAPVAPRQLRRLLLAALGIASLGAALVWHFAGRAPRSAEPAAALRPAPNRVLTIERSLPPTLVVQATRPAPADPALATIIGQSGLAFPARLAALHALDPARLTPADTAALRAFVLAPAPAWLRSGEALAFQNDILNLLGQAAASSTALHRSLLADLVGLASDSAQAPALRDYALQHLAGLLDQDPSASWGTHWRFALDTAAAPALAATAQLHLLDRHLRSSLPPAEATRLATAAHALAADTQAPAPSRASAIQVCAALRHPDVSPLALALAQDTTASIPLRIAAVSALGNPLTSDSAAIRALLGTLAQGPESRLRAPARAARNRF